MRAHTRTPHAATRPRRLALRLALLAALCCAAAAEARAASTCSIGFPVGTPLVGVNGLKDGAEWNDASRLLSSDSCFGQLADYDAVPKNLTVYTFVENMGGVVELVPVEMLRGGAEVPFQFNVSNGERERTVYHVVDVLVPAGAAGAEVGLDTARRVFAPNEQRVMRGFVRVPGKTDPPKDEEFRRWGLSLHAGATIPHGAFNNIYNPGPNAGVDLEYRLDRTFSLEAVYTFNRFWGETFDFPGGTFTVPDANLHVLSLNGKVYGSTSPVRPFFNFGGGVYVFGSGASTRGRLNVGGLQFDLTPTVALDSMYNFHNVFSSGSDLKYSTAQGGVRFRF